MEELQIAPMAEMQEAESWRRAHEAMKEESQRQSLELTHIKAAHQIALRNIQMTQAQLHELMSIPMLLPSTKSQDQEIATKTKDIENLLKQVQDLKNQVVGIKTVQSKGQSSRRPEQELQQKSICQLPCQRH